jgi:hypothetical protein
MLAEIRHQTGLLGCLYWVVLTGVDCSLCLSVWLVWSSVWSHTFIFSWHENLKVHFYLSLNFAAYVAHFWSASVHRLRFPCFSSVVRQMPGYNWKETWPAYPNHGGLQPKLFPPSLKSQGPSAKAIPTLLSSTPRHPSNQSSIHKRQIAWWDHPPTSSNNPSSEHVKAFSQDNNLVSVSTSPVIVYKALFTNSRYAFRTLEWLNLTRDDVLRSRKPPPLATFCLVGQPYVVTLSLGSHRPLTFTWRPRQIQLPKGPIILGWTESFCVFEEMA